MNINTWISVSAVALAATGLSGAALADSAETKGGLTIKTDDGRFSMKIGGRIHFDGYVGTAEDSIRANGLGDPVSTTVFRRARLSLEGKAYGWDYKFEEDFTAAGAAGIREMWLGTSVFGHNLRIGQAKPFRGMEELTSSNEIVFMERPFATASGLYSSNQFAQGLFLDSSANGWTWGISAYSLATGTTTTQGIGAAGRVTFAPIATDTATLHFGSTLSTDRPSIGAPATSAAAGRPFGRILGATAVGATSEDASAYGFELAGKCGPFYAQAEYADLRLNGVGVGENVEAYYVQASFLVTGESKPYDLKKGVFKSPKPDQSYGAVELKARYDVLDGEVGADDRLTQWIVGANYFVNPNVRFMLEFVNGAIEGTTETRGSVAQGRAQFSF